MKYCNLPFSNFYIQPNGNVSCCCFNPIIFGNLFTMDFLEVVNSEIAINFRKDIIHNGITKTCRKDCIYHRNGKNNNDSFKSELLKSDFNGIVMAFDNRCNLSCPSCRLDFFKPSTEYTSNLKILYSKIKPVLHLFKTFGTSSGDFFVMTEMLDIINDIPNDSRLTSYTISTNGQLMNKYNLEKIKNTWKYIQQILISVDAATEFTYPINRRGGDFNNLLSNIDYLNILRESNQIKCSLTLNFLIQNYNYKEILQFFKLAKQKNAGVFLQKFDRRGTLITQNDYIKEAVFEKTHENYLDLVNILKQCVTEFKYNLSYSTLPKHLIDDVVL
jgi:MoaA/NifB/PqqE/SkfB family radical SAM enzyme